MNIKRWITIKIANLLDCCKNCNCTLFECKNCTNREFYRHIDNKDKMKSNMKIIRKRKAIKIQNLIHKTKLFQDYFNQIKSNSDLLF